MFTAEEKNYIKEEVKERLDAICEELESSLHYIINQGSYSAADEISTIMENGWCTSGATKVVLCFNSIYNYVVKISTRTSINECEMESKIYEAAKRVGCEECFAEVDYLMEYDGVDIYIAEYCDCDEGEITDRVYDEYGSDCDSDILDYAAEFCWTDSEFRAVGELIRTFCINDLHCGNWGYDKRGRMKIVDYSGYKGLEERYETINKFLA